MAAIVIRACFLRFAAMFAAPVGLGTIIDTLLGGQWNKPRRINNNAGKNVQHVSNVCILDKDPCYAAREPLRAVGDA